MNLEDIFRQLIIETGAPMVTGHILADSSGTVLEDGFPIGHNNDLFALGIIMAGAVLARPATDGDEEGEHVEVDEHQWQVMKDDGHQWLGCMMLSREGLRSLIKDLSEIERITDEDT